MKQCQGSCVRGIKGEPVAIGELEAYVFDKAMEEGNSLLKVWKEEIEKNKEVLGNKKVAIIGGGPAGLTSAAFLAKEGVNVTIYEKYDFLGGLLMYGIPEFRLDKKIVEKTVQNILDLGINVEYGKELGKNLNLNELEEEYDAIFLSFGANCSSKMGVEGEYLKGVYGGNELLEYNMHPNYEGKTVVVAGGGNVAMDCARTIKRLGAKEVKVVYRRAREQMPAEDKEVEDAINEGIEFLFQNNIVKILGNENVEKLELIKTKLVQKEGDTRLSPVNVENSNYIIDADYVVMALGSTPATFVKDLGLSLNKWGNIEATFVKDLGLSLNKWGNIEVNSNYETSNPKIYAGGDLAGVRGTVAWAAYSGREAAKKIVEKLKEA